METNTNEFNTEVVASTLSQVVEILRINDIKYRFLGSVVLAAINKKLHRNLGDLDLIVDVTGRDILYKKLKNIGYKQAGGMFAFARKYLSLDQIIHPTLLDVGFFCGIWLPDGSFMIGGKSFSLSVEAYAMRETKYNLSGIEFIGIPDRAIATGINASKMNPKRKKELPILMENGIIQFPNNYIHVHFFGFKIDWIYYTSMKFLNILGNIRVKLGLAFDPWR